MVLVTPSALRVLVATADSGLNLRLLSALTSLRYSVQSVETGSEAAKILLGTSPPDIALFDSALPSPSGFELAAEIKRRYTLKRPWLVLLTTGDDSTVITAAADAGIDDLLLCSTSHSSDAAQESLETDLRVRLTIAARVQELGSELESKIRDSGFHTSHDQLTGLWNRESLLSLLFPETDRVQRIGTPLAFLLLDIDSFASINSEYSYDAGSGILRELGKRLRRYMRSYDLIGRCGDDELLIALPGCTSEQAIQLAARIRTILVHRPFAVGRDLVALTGSIGVSQSRGRSPLVVLREAERALANAKRDGRNCEREFVASSQPAEFSPPRLKIS